MNESQNLRLERLDEFRWRIPQGYRREMRVPCLIYAAEQALRQPGFARGLAQLTLAAQLPGQVKNVVGLPNLLSGLDFPLGGVMAMDAATGFIAPGVIGPDINAGVRLLKTALTAEQVGVRLRPLLEKIARFVPAGLGVKSPLKFKGKEHDVLRDGARWAVQQELGLPEDLAILEDDGQTDTIKASEALATRVREHLGTLGSGQHGIYLCRLAEIYDMTAANRMGLFIDQICAVVHTGGRGVGYAACDEALQMFERTKRAYQTSDGSIFGASITLPMTKFYLNTLGLAANFAVANRQVITHQIRQAFHDVFGAGTVSVTSFLDSVYNSLRREAHMINGRQTELYVYRKNAFRLWPAGHPTLPPAFASIGMPALLWGGLDQSIYLVGGTDNALRETFGSFASNSGRSMSRFKASGAAKSTAIRRSFSQQGITIVCQNQRTLQEELPQAYYPIDATVQIGRAANLIRPLARFQPIGHILG